MYPRDYLACGHSACETADSAAAASEFHATATQRNPEQPAVIHQQPDASSTWNMPAKDIAKARKHMMQLADQHKLVVRTPERGPFPKVYWVYGKREALRAAVFTWNERWFA